VRGEAYLLLFQVHVKSTKAKARDAARKRAGPAGRRVHKNEEGMIDGCFRCKRAFIPMDRMDMSWSLGGPKRMRQREETDRRGGYSQEGSNSTVGPRDWVVGGWEQQERYQ
jgi:hypothetical protein